MVAVRSWAWTSSPMTGSYRVDTSAGVPRRGGHELAILSLPLTRPAAASLNLGHDLAPTRAAQGAGPRDFEGLHASVLFCNRCRAPRPVRERLLLVLPDGELNEYRCSACGSSVGRAR